MSPPRESKSHLFSAFGLLYADVEHHLARIFRRLLRRIELADLNRAWDAMAAEARHR